MKKFLGFILAITMALSAWAQSATISWQLSTSPGVGSQNVYYGVLSHTYTNKVKVSATSTNVVINNLSYGMAFYFSATAVNTNGIESAFSNEASVTINNPDTNAPPTPTGLALNKIKGNFWLSWSYFTNMPNARYNFEVWDSNTVNGGFSLLTTTNQPPVNINVKGNNTAFYKVRAKDLHTGLYSGWSQ